MLRLFVLLLALCITAVDAAPAFAQAETLLLAQQEPRRRTLFDLLFGDPQPPQRQPVEQPRQTAPRQRTPTANLPPPKPTVEKAEGATRLAVFGDSLAVDLAKALERLYVDDPNLIVLDQGVGSSGFVREDYFNWNAAINDEIAKDSFDLAVIIVGINDRQEMRANGQVLQPLSDTWTAAYQARITTFLNQLRAAGKPAIWIGLPPMSGSSYSTAISQISAIHRLASLSGGAEFVDVYERFLGEDGKYSAYGPDLNGQNVRIRKDDGIHFSSAGADKLAFFVSQSVRRFYREGGISIEVADPLAGTDAGAMLRPPLQGLGQIRLLEVAGAVTPLTRSPPPAVDLISAVSIPEPAASFDLEQMVKAPVGRVDAFGVGISPGRDVENPAGR
ncbi:SGNH/GDSL hydrolase family protein [Devosia nitrariae]|uniref:SGNH hydrolase-type esterase domain-containing protein n=1 Tax=Devosia nitrariae TaxID=2071872 RepID=A0ABQ5WBN3_9HYPH|nr:DUF459 domain-containing protein [Devosia nitrariae]GLQ56935.1 hypothetical protein GCM10010862_41940 [Devosia nitrariae]